MTYNDIPLYYYAEDAAPGDTTGQDVGDVWYIVTPGMQVGDDPHEAGEDAASATPASSKDPECPTSPGVINARAGSISRPQPLAAASCPIYRGCWVCMVGRWRRHALG